jgi:hypothetical protein
MTRTIALAAVRHLKICSGTGAAPVNQTNQVTVTLVTVSA